MWKGSELCLAEYGITMCEEWHSRGYTDNMGDRIVDLVQDAMYQHVWGIANAGTPYWLGEAGFHLSHQSNLISKDPEYYQKYWPKVPPGLPYIWPPYREE